MHLIFAQRHAADFLHGLCGRLQRSPTLENGLLFCVCHPYLRKEQRNVSKYFLLSLHNENHILL